MNKEDQQLLEMAEHLDAWQNLAVGLGNAFRDAKTNTTFGAPADLGQQELEDLFAGNELAKKICHKPAKHMFREWFKIETKDEINDKFQAVIDEKAIIEKCIKGVTWSRLHGGGALLLGLDDGKETVEPLDDKNIKSLEWVTVLDRWHLIPKEYYTSVAKYKQPEIYEIVGVDAEDGAENNLIHESRVIRFDGTLTTEARKANQQGWSDSVFVAKYEVLRAWGHLLSSSETLITNFAQAIYKYKGLAQAIAAKGQELVKARAQVISLMRSILGMMVIDADSEDYDFKIAPLDGLAQMWDRFQVAVAGDFDMPVTVLFGRSPAGENATGESDIRNWYDTLAADRKFDVHPSIERLVKLIFLTQDGPTKGVEPKDWRIVWNPLWQESAKEKADTRKIQAETDALYIDRQVVHPDEVAESRFGGTEYSFETQLDQGLRKELKEAQEEEPEEPEDNEEQDPDADAE